MDNLAQPLTGQSQRLSYCCNGYWVTEQPETFFKMAPAFNVIPQVYQRLPQVKLPACQACPVSDR